MKPARGEQGEGVAVGLTTARGGRQAIEAAGAFSNRVHLEAWSTGTDLRLVVIDYRVVAAAIRRPARGLGRRATHDPRADRGAEPPAEAATQGESRIPIDAETERCLGARRAIGLDDVPAGGRGDADAQDRQPAYRRHDPRRHRRASPGAWSKRRSRRRARIDIPVVGIDLMVPARARPDYAFIEANERPGLANHEPQPTAERFVDLSVSASRCRHSARSTASSDGTRATTP